MKPSEYPEEDSRTVPFSTADEPARPAAAAEKPRYVEVPVSPEQARAQRNLAWAVVALVVTLIGVWIGFKFDRGGTLKCLAASLGTFGILWLLYNFQIHRQRHGALLGLGLTALLGAVLPFIAAGLGHLDRLADERVAGQPTNNGAAFNSDTPLSIPPPVPTAKTAPPAPSAPELSPDEMDAAVFAGMTKKAGTGSDSGLPQAIGGNPNVPPDGKTIDLPSAPIDLATDRGVAIIEDCTFDMGGRRYRLKQGEVFKFVALDVEANLVTLLAGNQKVEIAMDYVKFVGRSKEDKKRITEMAWREAMERFPALRDETSPENRLLNSTWVKMEGELDGAEFLKDEPRWPIILAEQLAAKHKWIDASGNVFTAPAPGTPDTIVPPDAAMPPPAGGMPENAAPGADMEKNLPPLDDSTLPANPPPLPRRMP